jgi:hypothetical protein
MDVSLVLVADLQAPEAVEPGERFWRLEDRSTRIVRRPSYLTIAEADERSSEARYARL